jgi:hypothetical protein
LYDDIQVGKIDEITAKERVMLAYLHADGISDNNRQLKGAIVVYGNAFFNMTTEETLKSIRDQQLDT